LKQGESRMDDVSGIGKPAEKLADPAVDLLKRVAGPRGGRDWADSATFGACVSRKNEPAAEKVSHSTVDVEKMARELGVLAPWERIAESRKWKSGYRSGEACARIGACLPCRWWCKSGLRNKSWFPCKSSNSRRRRGSDAKLSETAEALKFIGRNLPTVSSVQ
jgi:hypothetical protein